jgi:hypothetical protein
LSGANRALYAAIESFRLLVKSVRVISPKPSPSPYKADKP